MGVRIGISGSQGRMGSALRRCIDNTPGLSLGVLTVAPGTALRDAVNFSAVRPEMFDVWVDFTTPDASAEYVAQCVAWKKPIVVGTTGLSSAQDLAITAAGKQIPILYAPNMSVGINLCLAWAEQAARIFGATATARISEIHHQHKIDMPSGTALALGHAIAEASGKTLEDVEISASREGEVVGEHRAQFISAGETVSIQHIAHDRAIFAQGALRAAQWLINQPAGRYTMRDVLGLV